MGHLNRRRLDKLPEQEFLAEYRLIRDDVSRLEKELEETRQAAANLNRDQIYMYQHAAGKKLTNLSDLLERRQGELDDLEQVAAARTIDLAHAAETLEINDNDRRRLESSENELSGGIWMLKEGGRNLAKGAGLIGAGLATGFAMEHLGAPPLSTEIAEPIFGISGLIVGLSAAWEVPIGALSTVAHRLEQIRIKREILQPLTSSPSAGRPSDHIGPSISPGLS